MVATQNNLRKRASRLAAGSTAWLLGATLTAGVIVSVFSITTTQRAQAQNTAKIVEGKVYDAGSTPLPGGIVYLQDQKTNVVKTFIATADGSYRFGQLPADTDYKLWAKFNGDKSKDKLISSFDSKMVVNYDFHIGK